jgi:hypothetical protein
VVRSLFGSFIWVSAENYKEHFFVRLFCPCVRVKIQRVDFVGLLPSA